MPGLVQGSGGQKSSTMTQDAPTLSHELGTMPIVDSVCGFIGNAKNTPMVGTGFQIAGWSFGVVAHQVNACCGDIVKAADQFAGGYMVAFKDQYPILREPTSDVVDHVKDNASRMAKTGARTFIQSYPGQTIMDGLDVVIAGSSYVLKKIQPSTKSKKASPRKPTRFSKNAVNGKSDPKDPKTKSTESSKSTQTPKKDDDGQTAVKQGILKKLQPKEARAKTLITWTYQMIVVSPVKITLKSLLRVRSALQQFEDSKSKPTGMSPENATEIESRRKVSPRKRLTNTFFGRVRTTARRFLGLGSKAISLTQADIRNYFSCDKSPCHSDDAERKRKYDDIQTDPDSEDSLADFDIDKYRSDEDSDYEVPSGNSTDSMEYEAGETESDVSVDEESNPTQAKDSKGKSEKPAVNNKPTNKNKPNQNTGQKVNGTDSKPTTNSKTNDKPNNQPGKPTESKTTTSGKSETPKGTSAGSDKSQPTEKSSKENVPPKTGTAS